MLDVYINQKIIITILIFIYLFFIFPFIGQVPLGDEALTLIYAQYICGEKTVLPQSMFSTNVYGNSPLYFYFLIFYGKLMGEINANSSHYFGITCFIITLILIYKITIILGGKKEWAVFTIFLYVINPMAIQGSIQIDIDFTILPVFLLFFIYVFFKLQNKLSFFTIFCMSVIYALCWWTKMALGVILFLTFLIYLPTIKDRNKIFKIIIMLLCGFFLFLMSWFIYSYSKNIPFVVPFLYNKNRLLYGASWSNLISFFKIVFYISLWSGPFFLYPGLFISIKEIIKDQNDNNKKFLAIIIFIIFFGYCLVGKVYYGFPKYHYPLISLLTIFWGIWLSKNIHKFRIRNRLLLIGIMIIILTLYYFYFVSDILYLVNYTIKERMIMNSSLMPLFFKIIWNLFLYLIVFFILLGLLQKYKIFSNENINNLLISCVIISISISLSTNFLHRNAEYRTDSCYGSQGLAQVSSYLRKRIPEIKKILGPWEFAYIFRDTDVLVITNWAIFDDKELFLKTIMQDVDVIIYEIGFNSIKQYREVYQNPQIANYLAIYYDKYNFGSYILWKKKHI